MALPDETKQWVYIGETDGVKWQRSRMTGEPRFRSDHYGDWQEYAMPPAKSPLGQLSARYDRLLSLGWVEVDRNETHVLYEAADSEVNDSEPWELGEFPSRRAGTWPYERGYWRLGRSGLATDHGSSGANYIPRDEPAKGASGEFMVYYDARRAKTSTPPAVAVVRCKRCTIEPSWDAQICVDTGLCGHCACDLRNGQPERVAAAEPRCACGQSLVTNKTYAGKCADCYHGSFNDSLKRPPAFPDVARMLALTEQQHPREWFSGRNPGRRRL